MLFTDLLYVAKFLMWNMNINFLIVFKLHQEKTQTLIKLLHLLIQYKKPNPGLLKIKSINVVKTLGSSLTCFWNISL